MRDTRLFILLFCAFYVCGCANDRIARVAERHIESRDQLLQLLGRPDRIIKADGESKWHYRSHGFNLFLLKFWRYNLICLVDETGKVTDMELTGWSRQYHVIPPNSLPKEFEGFGEMSNTLVAAQAENPSLSAHRLAGGEYVLVADLACFYSLGRDQCDSREWAVYRTDSAQLVLEAGHREVQINGVQHWLSTPVLSARGQLWVAGVDALETIDPIFRQGHSRTPSLIRTYPRL